MSIIIRLQNLSWSANSLDIRQYFQGLFIPEGGVHIVGGENGDVFIAFGSDEDARQAMQKDGGKLKDMKIKLLLSSRAEMQRVIEQARVPTLIPPVVTISSSPPPPSSSQQTTTKEISTSKDERSRKSPEKRRSDRSSRERSRERDRSSKKSSRRSRSRSPRRNRDKDRDSDRRSKRDDRYKSNDDRHKSQDRSRGKDETSETSRISNSKSSNIATTANSEPNFVGPNTVSSPKMDTTNPAFRPAFDQSQRQESTWNNGNSNNMNFNMGMTGGPSSNMFQGNRPPFPVANEMHNTNHISRFDQQNYFPRASFGPNSANSFSQIPGNMPLPEYGMSSTMADPRTMPNVQGGSGQNFNRMNMDPRIPPDIGNRPMEMNRTMNNTGMAGGMTTPIMMQEKQSYNSRMPGGIVPPGMMQDKQSPFNSGMPGVIIPPGMMQEKQPTYNSGMPGGIIPPGMMQDKQSTYNSGMPGGIVTSGMMQDKQSTYNPGMPGGIVASGMMQEKQPPYNSAMPNNFSGPMPGLMGNVSMQGFGMMSGGLIPEKAGPNNMRGVSDVSGRDPRSMSNARELEVPRKLQDAREKSGARGPLNEKPRESPETRGSHSTSEPKRSNNNNTEFAKPNKKNTNPDQQTCIEMKGLPLFVAYSHIRDFFRGISIPTDGIKIINNDQGQRTGNAYVRFNSEKDRMEGLKRTGNEIDKKSVTLGRVSYQAFSDAIDSFLPPGMEPPKVPKNNVPEQAEMCIMMKGLPFSSKNTDISVFFNGIDIKNMYIEQDIGLKRGTGFVEFSTPDGLKAAMTRNGKPLGDGYIELTVITKEEMQLQMAKKNNALLPAANPKLAPTNCLAVHGLPSTVIDRQLADFFGEAGFVPHAIHMMLGASGKPTGDAYIEFNNPHECEVGLRRNGHLIGSKPIQTFPIPYQEMVAILNSTGDVQQGVQPGNMYENKPLLGTPLLNTPKGPMDLPQNFMERPCKPEMLDNHGEPNTFPSHSENMHGYANGPQRQFDFPQGPDNRHGLLDTPRGYPEGPRGEPIESRKHPSDPRGIRGDPRGRPPTHSLEQPGNPRGPFDNSRGPEERVEGPWGNPDGPRGHSDGPRGHPGGPRGYPDGARGHPDGPRGHSDDSGQYSHDQRKHLDEPRGYPDGPKRHSDNSLLGPMNGPRVGLLDNARGRPLLGDGMEHGRPPLLDSHDRLIMDPRGPARDGPPDSLRGPEGKRKGRPLLELEDGGHFNHDENRRHPRNRNRGYGDFNSAMQEDHPAHMGHRNGAKPYHDRASGPPTENLEMAASVNGFGPPGCVVGASNVPYRATMNDIMAFFDGFGLSQENVIRRYDGSGRVTGDVRVAFHSPDDAHRAMTELDGAPLRGRNVSLFMP